jgi:hypothetical protein
MWLARDITGRYHLFKGRPGLVNGTWQGEEIALVYNRFLKPTKIYYSANLWSNPKIRVINRQFFTNWFSSKD